MNYFHGDEPVAIPNPESEVEAVIYEDYLSKDRPVGKSNSAFVVRKDIFQSLGGFRYKPVPTFPCDDIDFLLRAGLSGPAVLILNPSTVLYRRHGGNVSLETDRVVRSLLHVIRSEREGVYPRGRSRMLDRYSFIGGVVFNWTRKAFSSGCPVLGLQLFTSGFPMVLAAVIRKLLTVLRGRKPTIKIKL